MLKIILFQNCFNGNTISIEISSKQLAYSLLLVLALTSSSVDTPQLQPHLEQFAPACCVSR